MVDSKIMVVWLEASASYLEHTHTLLNRVVQALTSVLPEMRKHFLAQATVPKINSIDDLINNLSSEPDYLEELLLEPSFVYEDKYLLLWQINYARNIWPLYRYIRAARNFFECSMRESQHLHWTTMANQESLELLLARSIKFSSGLEILSTYINFDLTPEHRPVQLRQKLKLWDRLQQHAFTNIVEVLCLIVSAVESMIIQVKNNRWSGLTDELYMYLMQPQHTQKWLWQYFEEPKTQLLSFISQKETTKLWLKIIGAILMVFSVAALIYGATMICIARIGHKYPFVAITIAAAMGLAVSIYYAVKRRNDFKLRQQRLFNEALSTIKKGSSGQRFTSNVLHFRQLNHCLKSTPKLAQCVAAKHLTANQTRIAEVSILPNCYPKFAVEQDKAPINFENRWLLQLNDL